MIKKSIPKMYIKLTDLPDEKFKIFTANIDDKITEKFMIQL